MPWTRLRGEQPPPIRYADPLEAGRHPFQTFMLLLAFVSSLPLIFGEPTAKSVEAALPAWAAYSWGMSLVIGSGMALIGSYWPREQYATALTLERIGLGFTGMAAIIYALLILVVTQVDPTFGLASGIILGFGVACIKRARDIGKIIRRALLMQAGVTRPSVETEAEADAAVQDRRERRHGS